MSIFGWFGRRIKAFAAALKNLVGSDAVKALLKTAEGQIATAVVTELSDATWASLSNDAKRREAFNRIKERALASGIQLRDSAIGLLIELVISRLKAA